VESHNTPPFYQQHGQKSPDLPERATKPFVPTLKTADMSVPSTPSNGLHDCVRKLDTLAQIMADNKDDLITINAIPMPELDAFLKQEVGKMAHLRGGLSDAPTRNLGWQRREDRDDLLRYRWQDFIDDPNSLIMTPVWALKLLAYEAVSDEKECLLKKLS
jgi:hypothetical protein